ncbi:MAG: ACP S-malonyltransferase [Oligoflexia bacterium]|nr:ACP S-malonyltransferase [Oligoflexia bacterium]
MTSTSFKATILFPGQGQQFVGMGADFPDDLLRYFQIADKVLQYPLSEIAFKGPASTLRLTENAQPAIVAYEMALFSKVKTILESEGVSIERVLGHSVGEYSALVAASTLSFHDAIKLVHLRGKYMQTAVPVGVGGMMAILKAPVSEIERACHECSDQSITVVPANYNCPDQVVISGHLEGCNRVVSWLEQNLPSDLRWKAIPLEVSAPFHSPLMAPASKQLLPHLSDTEFRPNQIPYIANIDATEYATSTSPDTIRHNLLKQVAGSVFWTQSIQKIDSVGTQRTLFIEVGPGKVLKGMVKKILPQADIISVCSANDLNELVKELVNVNSYYRI